MAEQVVKSRPIALNAEIVGLTKTTEVYHVTFQPACSIAIIAVGQDAWLTTTRMIGNFAIPNR